MFKNDLKQTWRSISKNKTYSLLNIMGLSAGLTCLVFIALWVNDELNYDKFNQNYDRIHCGLNKDNNKAPGLPTE